MATLIVRSSNVDCARPSNRQSQSTFNHRHATVDHDRHSQPRIRASNSPTVRPVTGSRQSGAISASGASTNARSRNRGCGTVRPGSSSTASPYRIRSRSSVRGAPGAAARARTGARSRAGASAARAGRATSPRRPRRSGNRGCAPTPTGAVSWNEDTRRSVTKPAERVHRLAQVALAIPEVAAKRDRDWLESQTQRRPVADSMTRTASVQRRA